jgi:putative transposase
MKLHSNEFRIKLMAEVLSVSPSGYYAWLRRGENRRENKDKELAKKIIELFKKSKGIYGSRKIRRELKRVYGLKAGRAKVSKLMDENKLFSKVRKKYKATTNSGHNLPVAENHLNQDFIATRPKQKIVSDITYIATDEGWLYLACMMDLYGSKIVGVSMGSRMTKKLVIDALKDAVSRHGKSDGGLAHSDRGSQYCSHEYQRLLKQYGFKCSMSRKGNCYDNAPMESFFGKLKQEWLRERRFKTRKEAEAAIFEYIWIFYNRERIHAANDYITPHEYYYQAA